MKSMIIQIDDYGLIYPCLVFICPGCALSSTGLHMLAVNTEVKKPAWQWNENTEYPTLSPSILSKFRFEGLDFICHSFLSSGVFNFLDDCTHELKGQSIIMPDLPDWFIEEG